MATLAAATVMSRAGQDVTTLAAAAAGGGDKWANTGAEFLVVYNAAISGNCVVTLVLGVGGVVDGLTPAAKTVTVLPGKVAVIGPFPVGFYNDATGFASVTYSQVVTVNVLVMKPGT